MLPKTPQKQIYREINSSMNPKGNNDYKTVILKVAKCQNFVKLKLSQN